MHQVVKTMRLAAVGCLFALPCACTKLTEVDWSRIPSATTPGAAGAGDDGAGGGDGAETAGGAGGAETASGGAGGGAAP